MPHLFLIFSQSDYLIQIVDINSHTQRQTVKIQIIKVLQKPTDLALHYLQRQDISRFSRTRVKLNCPWKPHIYTDIANYVERNENKNVDLILFILFIHDYSS